MIKIWLLFVVLVFSGCMHQNVELGEKTAKKEIDKFKELPQRKYVALLYAEDLEDYMLAVSEGDYNSTSVRGICELDLWDLRKAEKIDYHLCLTKKTYLDEMVDLATGKESGDYVSLNPCKSKNEKRLSKKISKSIIYGYKSMIGGCSDFHYGVDSPKEVYMVDGKHLTLEKDGSFALRSSRNEILLHFYRFSNAAYAVVSPKGYYLASQNGVKYIATFKAKKSRPDIIKAILSNESSASLFSVDRDRYVQMAPEISIDTEKIHIDKKMLTFPLSISNKKSGIGDVRMYIDGVLVKTVSLNIKDATAEFEKTFSVQTAYGPHILRVITRNFENSMFSNEVSYKYTLTKKFTNEISTKPTYLVAIGIDEYANGNNLRYAISDAIALSKELNSTFTILLTTKEETSKENIVKTLNKLQKEVDPESTFIFFMAGHGASKVVDNRLLYYMFTSDVDGLELEDLNKYAINQEELTNLIGNIPALNKMIIFDTCQAGIGGRALFDKMSARGVYESTFNKFQKDTGISIITASSGLQSAQEGYNGHGALTYAVLEALKRADNNADGYVDNYELIKYVKSRVPEIGKILNYPQQYPYFMPYGKIFSVTKLK